MVNLLIYTEQTNLRTTQQVVSNNEFSDVASSIYRNVLGDHKTPLKP